MNVKTKKIVKASVLLLGVSWYSRLLSAVSVVVLARSLTKEDFGILASCFIVQGFFNLLSNVGSQQYLIRKSDITEDDINAAWTINLFSKCAMAVLIFVFSEPAANYMNIPEMALVLKVMSLSAIFIGFNNPAVNLKIKELDYKKISVLEVIAKSIASTVSVVIAVVYHTYWAVVISGVLYNLLNAIGSQFIVRHKLKLVRDGVALQWEFSKWVLLKGIISYIKSAFDKIIVGKGYSVGELGLYNFSNEASSTALQFFISPINKVLYPGLSEYVNDKQVLVDKVYKSILVLFCIYIPIVFGGAYLSDTIVPLVFGEKWLEAVPLFQAFLIMSLARLGIGVLTDVFTLTGEVKKQFLYEVITSAIFLVIILSASSLDLVYFAICRVGIAYIMLMIITLTLRGIIHISFLKILSLNTPLILSSVLMLLCIQFFSGMFSSKYEVVNLILSIGLGALCYGFTTLILISYLKRFFNEYDFLYKTFVLPLYKLLKIVK